MTENVSIRVPKLSMAVVEATFVEWLVPDGQQVAEEEPIYSIATDKVETEILSPASGVLRHGDAEPDEVYPIGTELGVIEVGAS